MPLGVFFRLESLKNKMTCSTKHVHAQCGKFISLKTQTGCEMKNTETIKTERMYRSFQIDRSEGSTAIDIEARTVQLAFSSEAPVKRWFGSEVLDHNAASIRLGRLANGGPLLDNHDPDEQIGVVESVSIGADKVGRALVRFSKSEEGEEMFQDVVDGIRRHVSVGYVIYKYVEETTTEAGGRESTICRITDWEPLEISLVAIPADTSIGIGRAAGAEQVETQIIRAEVGAAIPQKPELKPTQGKIIMDQANQDARNEGAAAEQKRTADLLALSETYAKYGAREMVADFIRNGRGAEAFQSALMEKITSRHSSASDLEIGLTDKEVRGYSLVRAISAAISGNWKDAGFERAASDAVAKRSGFSPEGFFVPVEAFGKRAFDVGTAGNAGNVVGTNLMGGEFVDVLRNKLVLDKLGVRVLGGLSSNIAIPRKATTITPVTATEMAAFTAQNPTTNQITLSPKRIGATVPYTKQSLLQGSIDVEAMLRDDLAQSIAVMIENMVINGNGTAPNPRGLLNQAGIGSVIGGVNGAAITWAHIIGLESAVANANSEPDSRSGYLINTKTRGSTKQTTKGAGGTFLPIFGEGDTPLNGYRAAVTNNMVSNGIKGTGTGLSSLIFSADWSDLIIGMFGGLDVVIDPYSLAGSGQVVITANQFIDCAVRQPASFAAMADAITV